MEPQLKNALFAAVVKLLRPLVRILLRNGVPFGAFADLARWVYVDVAAKEFGIPGRKQTDSRVSILTGLSRKEVRRIKMMDHYSDEEAISRYNRAARVIAGWLRDRRFLDPHRRPQPLPIEGATASFSELVKTYSGDVPPRAILDELLNVGAVKKTDGGRVALQAKAYLPAGDKTAQLGILGTDVAHLLATIDHNIHRPEQPRRFQRKVLYDNLPAEAVEAFRRLSSRKSQRLLKELDHWLAARDRDVDASVAGSGRKVLGLGIYYFEDDWQDDSSQP